MSIHAPMLLNFFLATALSMTPVAAQQAAGGAATPSPVTATFKGTAVNLNRVTGESITIDLRRWSSDEDRTKLFTTYTQKGVGEVAAGMPKAESIGYLWRSGSGVGTFIRYAFESKMPDGRTRVVLVTDPTVREWSGTAAAPSTPEEKLMVIELRLPATGPGEGKFAAKIAPDVAASLLTVDGYDAAPVVFRGVTRAKK